MSKSLTRVTRALANLDLPPPVEATQSSRTAAEAAAAIGVEIDQIGKSMIFAGVESGTLHLFLTAGGSRVDATRAAILAGEPLARADAATIRAVTGFAIGGVSPVGHLTPVPVYIDARLMEFETIWCAAGTPNHNFPSEPAHLRDAIGAQVADFATSGTSM